MKAVLQRVTEAKVVIDEKVAGQIEAGMVILLGVSQGDTERQADRLADKISQLRIFCDAADKINLSLLDTKGSALVVSNFTLCADSRKGRRPSFDKAAAPNQAHALYEYFIERLKALGVGRVETGEFGADMQLTLTNDDPVTIWLDTDLLA